MYQRKPRRFRRRSNDRRHSSRVNGDMHKRLDLTHSVMAKIETNLKFGMSPEKQFEKYSII